MTFVAEKSNGVPVAQDDQHEVVANVVVITDNDTENSVKKDVDTISLSSSIGLLSDGNGGDEDSEEAESKAQVEGSLNSFATLEAALPFKRGLSDFYDGKSKTFMNLTEVKSVEEIEKEESSLNKRRRLTVAQSSLYKWGSSNSSSSLPHFTSTSGEKTHSVGVQQEFKSSPSRININNQFIS
ncbi:unnamed protein product [Withania somnifera]